MTKGTLRKFKVGLNQRREGRGGLGRGLEGVEFATDGSKTQGEDARVGYGWCLIEQGQDIEGDYSEKGWDGPQGGGWLSNQSSNNSAEVRALADVIEKVDVGVNLKGYIDSMYTIEGTRRGVKRG